MTAHVAYIFEEVPIPRKDGTPGLRSRMAAWPYSPINACDRCGVLGGLRKVTERNDVWRWNVVDRRDWSTKSMSTLCVACWNAAKAIASFRARIEEIGYLARKLEREARRAKQD